MLRGPGPFFFSSRRRHTRCLSDWSSDVCSSDLNTLERMYPGMIEYLKPGEDIKFNSPAATGGYREYLTTELQGIGAGVDVPYELLSGDLSLVNYSSYRAGMLGFRNAIEAFRWLTLIPMLCRPTWRRFIDTLVLLRKQIGRA